MYCRLHVGHMLNQECATTRWGAATYRGYIPERLPTMPHLVFILSLAVPVLNSSLQLSIPSAISYVIDFQTTHTQLRHLTRMPLPLLPSSPFSSPLVLVGIERLFFY